MELTVWDKEDSLPNIHTGTAEQAEELWDLVDLSKHDMALLQDDNGAVVCSYNYFAAE